MVVVTLESTCMIAPDDTSIAINGMTSTKHPLLIENTHSRLMEQSVVSASMLQNHRRTLSPDKLLFLKVPESTMESLVELQRHKVPQHPQSPVVSTPEIRLDGEAVSRKRAVSPAEDHYQEAAPEGPPPLKKTRLVLHLSSPVRRTVRFELIEEDDDADQEQNLFATDNTTGNSNGNGKDKQGTIKTHVRLFERVEAEDIANLWWSGEEMFEIMTREKSAISVMSYCCQHYTTQVLCLMKIARGKTYMPGMATSESSAPLWVANSPARGLEKDIVQGFKQRKRQVIRKVLESQRVLKSGRHEITGEDVSADMQSRLLSNQYQKWSDPMVRFAQVLAEGDAQAVVDNATAVAL